MEKTACLIVAGAFAGLLVAACSSVPIGEPAGEVAEPETPAPSPEAGNAPATYQYACRNGVGSPGTRSTDFSGTLTGTATSFTPPNQETGFYDIECHFSLNCADQVKVYPADDCPAGYVTQTPPCSETQTTWTTSFDKSLRAPWQGDFQPNQSTADAFCQSWAQMNYTPASECFGRMPGTSQSFFNWTEMHACVPVAAADAGPVVPATVPPRGG